MKVCFIGACGHTKRAYQYLSGRKDVILCGFAPWDEREGRSESFAADVPFFADARTMLDEIRPDLAVVSPIFGQTAAVIEECASRGIDVFSEKPVATTLADLERVERCVRESGIRFCAMHYLRYAPAFWHAAGMIREGKIGKVQLVTAQKSYRFGARPAWYWDRELYGGTIPWVGIHAIDWIYHLSGKRFVSVRGKSLGSPERAALCQFELEGGIPASMNLDFYRPAAAPTHDDDRIRVVGDEGVLEVREKTIFLINGEGAQTLTPIEAPELLEEFLAGGGIGAEEIFYLTRVALLAREAADTQTTVRIGGTV